jgi:hypothetical protein
MTTEKNEECERNKENRMALLVVSIRAGSHAACAVLSLLVRAHLVRGLGRDLWG